VRLIVGGQQAGDAGVDFAFYQGVVHFLRGILGGVLAAGTGRQLPIRQELFEEESIGLE
jgi:hypothetical protein